MKDTPLKVEIKDDELVIRCGLDTLKMGTENHPKWLDEIMNPTVKVININELALDMKRAMLREKEDGSTPLSDFLDDIAQDAYDDGSEGFEYN